MQFVVFASTVLLPIESTLKKLSQAQLLSEFFTQAEPEEIAPAVYFVLGQFGPIYANPQANFGVEYILHSLTGLLPLSAEQTDLFGAEQSDRGTLKTALKRRYKQLGDLGLLAEELQTERLSRSSAHVKVSQLTIQEVFALLHQVTRVTGEGSQEDKITRVQELFAQLGPLESRYVARFLVGSLRLGISDRTILDAVSWGLVGDKSLRDRLDAVYQRHPDIGELAQVAFTRSGGIEAVETLNAELGVPVLPALCDRLKTADEMIAKMGAVFVEPKYDGTRLQIHWDGRAKKVRVFTRNLEESTHMFPELPGLLEALGVESLILDAEGVGYDPETGKLVAFQQTIKRKRKHDIEATAAAIPLRFFVFDVLLFNGKACLDMPLRERRALLTKILGEQSDADLIVSPAIETDDADELRAFHLEQLAAGLEGVVIKKVDGVYQPGRKAFNWVKFKEAEGSVAKLTDTIDAVVLGYYAGRGKRSQFGVGAFLVGVIDPAREQILTIAKIGTGLTDDQWRELKQRVDAIESGQKSSQSASGVNWSPVLPELLTPDVIIPPQLVVEVAADEITQSPTHTAGVALRFPRLVRFRDDKSVEQATTRAELDAIKVG